MAAGACRNPQGPVPVAELVVRMAADEPGRNSVRARATDAAGNVQPEVPVWNRLGYGNNAVEVSHVDVRRGEPLVTRVTGRVLQPGPRLERPWAPTTCWARKARSPTVSM